MVLATVVEIPTASLQQESEHLEFQLCRIVRLMVAGTHGAEEITAEFLFVLCKQNG